MYGFAIVVSIRVVVVIRGPPARARLMTTIRDRLSRHRELLGSSKVVFLSPGVAGTCNVGCRSLLRRLGHDFVGESIR